MKRFLPVFFGCSSKAFAGALSLPIEFTKTASKRSLVKPVFRPSMAVLLMIGADFLHFALILAHYWRLLPTG
jgi:hypothetical protein